MKNKFLIIGGIMAGIIVTCGTIYRYEGTKKSIASFTKKQDEITYTQSDKNNKQLTIEEKIQDFNYVYNLLKENYPYFGVNKRKTGFDWLANKENFEKEIKETKDDVEFYNKMIEIFTTIQNGHTNIIYPDRLDYFQKSSKKMPEWNRILNGEKVNEKAEYWKMVINRIAENIIPINFDYIEGKYVVSNPYNTLGIKEGSILTKVNSIDVNSYVKSLINKNTLVYDYERKQLKLNKLYFIDNKEFEINLTLITPEGKVEDKKVKSITYSNTNSNTNGRSKSDNFITRILSENKIAYLKVQSMDKEDNHKIFDFYREIKNFPYLIIDIRGNGGGKDLCWKNYIVKPLIKGELVINNFLLFKEGTYIKNFIAENSELEQIKSIKTLPYNKNYPKEISEGYKEYIELNETLCSENYSGFKGKIYLLVDDYVFSSAESFAAFAKANKFAELIGTTTGGDGIGFDPMVASMPNSGLVFRFTGHMALNPDGTANEETHTEPDMYCELKYDDFIKMLEYKKDDKNDKIICPYDTVLNKAIELCK